MSSFLYIYWKSLPLLHICFPWAGINSPTPSLGWPLSASVALCGWSLWRMARSRATKAGSGNCSPSQAQGMRNDLKGKLDRLFLRVCFVSVYPCTQEVMYQLLKFWSCPSHQHLHAGVRYWKNSVYEWPLWLLGSLPILNTLKSYLWGSILT